MNGAAPPSSGSALIPPFPRPPVNPEPPPRVLLRKVRRAGLGLVGRLYTGSSTRTPVRSLLLIRPDHLGDLLFVTPALHALRRALPDARITLLAGPWGAEAVRHNADLDEVLVLPFPGFERRPKESLLGPYRLLAEHAGRLAGRGHDTAVILRFDHWWGAWLAAAAGIPRRVGYDLPEVRPFLTERVPYQPGRHEVRQNATLLAALVRGLENELGPTRYVVTEQDTNYVASWLAERGIRAQERVVAIHPGAGATVKQWPVESWAEIATRLSGAGAQVVVTGGPGERELAAAVAAQARAPVLDAAGHTTLAQLAALYRRCGLVFGSDSGPLHLAVAVGAYTLHLHGPVPASKFGPWGDPARHVVVTSPFPCVPCDRLDWRAEALPRHLCLAAIDREMVWYAVEGLLHLSSQET